MKSGNANHVRIHREREVRAHAELWHASGCVLKVGQQEARGSAWQYLSCIVLTAFAFEAYLGYVGPAVMERWENRYGKLPPRDKYVLLAVSLGVEFPGFKDGEYLDAIRDLFIVRNRLAHGRTEIIKPEDLVTPIEQYEDELRNRPRTDWQERIEGDEFAVRARAAVDAALKLLHGKCPPECQPHWAFGIGTHQVTGVDDAYSSRSDTP